MGVYIDMEMPTEGGTICVYKISGKFFAARAGKDELFPIIPIHGPHGRLIDADAVTLEDGPYEYDDWCKWALERYQDAPTVIPASGC